MPVYICQAGANSSEPWRHGLQVYAAPFQLMDLPEGHTSDDHNNDNVCTVAPRNLSSSEGTTEAQRDTGNNDPLERPFRPEQMFSANNSYSNSINREQQHLESLRFGLPVRRIRHAEVVLVDDVCIAYDRHWLRLRWPGHKGGFAGYVALGKVNETSVSRQALEALQPRESAAETETTVFASAQRDDFTTTMRRSQEGGGSRDESEEEDREGTDEDGNREDDLQDVASALTSEPVESISAFCLRTGIEFPSSGYMKLMAVYDDGLSPAVSSSPNPTEPIFCRICREGLHDDADDEQDRYSAAEGNEDGENSNSNSNNNSNKGEDEPFPSDDDDGYDSEGLEIPNSKGPVHPHPVYRANANAMENPLISPCECSGSMAFVHYLCIEQWRCRSRHPKARRGLNCETCGSAYALPPPSARPVDNEDWLEAMPPHVINALRHPHIWWQIGAAIVRRRWLRPIAPVIMSPIVALYCTARRLLKKKGVARRRWACSLCRRRARWKCVRCLRSYYCSRQCQNVSWHIVHKHVCYKPSRWFMSVLVYGIATLLAFPGILRDPLVYDLGFSFIPLSFYVMAILGGGIATTLKKSISLDLRGRAFEVVVILLTLGLVIVSWGLLAAFFGDSSRCYGVLGSQQLSENDQLFQFLVRIQKSVLEPAKHWFLMWDRFALNSGAWPRKILCMPGQKDVGCFEHSHKANADFMFDDVDGGRCSMDMVLVSSLLQGAALVAAGNHYWKRRERQRRAARRPRRHHDQ
mmetsp:Transcript_9014/g.22348  ORF Transcript_9014/g.22348 Transcript_9014/m.22348 type:complete len:750 (+) Transcript_9014:172-2421(+)